MNNLTKVAVVMVVVVAIFGCIIAVSEDSDAASTFYVGGDGASDSNPGSDDAPFETFEKAIASVKQGDIIKLNGDVTTTPVSINVRITLNLNEHTLTIVNGEDDSDIGIQISYTGTSSPAYIRNGTIIDDRGSASGVANKTAVEVHGAGSKLTLSDVTIKSYGSDGDGYNYAVRVNDGATLTLNSGSTVTEMISDHDTDYGVVGIAIKGNGTEDVTTLVVNNGVTIDTGAFAIAGNGTYHNTSITINGGTITSDSQAIYHPQSGDLVIVGSPTITGETGIEMRSGNLTITGNPTITATGGFKCEPNGNGSTTSGVAVAIVQHTTQQKINVSISGGNYSGVHSLYENNPQGNPSPSLSGIKIDVTGGTFSGTNGAVKFENYSDMTDSHIRGGSFADDSATSYMPSDYKLEQIDGSYYPTSSETDSVAKIDDMNFVSIETAILAGKGKTITLLDNIEQCSAITLEDGDYTINLNGHNISFENVLFTIAGDAKLTVKDEPEGSTSTEVGYLKGSKNYFLTVDGELDLQSGKIVGTNSYSLKIGTSATLDMTGGTIETGNNYAVSLAGIANISGGTVGKIYFVNSKAVLNIGTPESTSGPAIESIRPTEGTVHFYYGTVGSVTSAFGSESTFTSNGIFTSEVSGKYIPQGFVLRESSTPNQYYIDRMTESDAAAKIVRPGLSEPMLFSTIDSAATAVVNGDTLVLLDDFNDTLILKIYNGTIDLNGHSINATGEKDDYGIEIIPGYGTYVDGSVVLVNNGDSKSSVTSKTPLYTNSGDSTKYLDLKIGDNIEFTSTDDSGLIELGTSARLIYTDAAVAMINNGVFKSTTGGVDYIYGTAAAAMKASDDNKAELLGDYVGKIALNSPGSYELDLGGHTVTYTITIDTEKEENNVKAAIEVTSDDTSLTVTNGTITTNAYGAFPGMSSSGVGENIPNDNIDLVLENVILTSGYDFGIYSNGTCTNIDVKVISSKIECTDTNGVGIYFPAEGTLEIVDSEITGTTGVEIRKGSLSISGDMTSITSNAESYNVGETPSGGGNTVAGAAVAISPYSGIDALGVEITGGSFSGPVAFAQVNADGNAAPEFDFSISGGSFTSTGKDENNNTYPAIVAVESEVTEGFVTGGSFSSIDEGLISSDSKLEQNEDGTWDVQTAYTVTFDVRGTKTSVKVIGGETVQTTDIPAINPGYDVTWTVDGVQWDSSAPVTANITVTAVLTVKDDVLVLSSTNISGYVDGVNVHTYVAQALTDFDAVWSVENAEIATVSNEGVITFIKAGKTALTVTVTLGYGDEVSKSTLITVATVPVVDGVKFEPASDEDLMAYDESLSSALMSIPEDWQNDGTSASLFLLDSDETTFILPYSVFDAYGWNLTSQNYADYDFITIHLLDGGGYEFPKTDATSEGLAITVSSTSPFVFLLKEKTGTDDGSDHPSFNPYPGDDDDYLPLPPTIVYEDDGSDSTASIAACAAAAVVAAILAIVLASTYRRK